MRAVMLGVVAADGVSWDVNQQASCHDDLCKKTLDDVLPALIALGAGLAFVIVDDTVLSVAHAPMAGSEKIAARFAMAPTLAPASGGMSMGLVGTSEAAAREERS